ncbi:hypothetical protein AB6A40_008483 [Gnathostoma spinigerum]|uniref:VWFA domain-containing protein n=1 Tax=Gnathostoma spinigerum TaxID=75299 RepID=A0ABD6EUB1_9BILA
MCKQKKKRFEAEGTRPSHVKNIAVWFKDRIVQFLVYLIRSPDCVSREGGSDHPRLFPADHHTGKSSHKMFASRRGESRRTPNTIYYQAVRTRDSNMLSVLPFGPRESSTTTTNTNDNLKRVSRTVAILVDASKNVDRELLLKAAAFVRKDLIAEFNANDAKHSTSVLIAPYGFDMGHDLEHAIDLSNTDLMKDLIRAIKTSEVMTIVDPLDDVQSAVTLSDLTDLQSQLTHVIILASGKGTDFETVKELASAFRKNKTKLISVSLNNEAATLQGLASTPECMLAADGFQNEELAKKIGDCVFGKPSQKTAYFRGAAIAA